MLTHEQVDAEHTAFEAAHKHFNFERDGEGIYTDEFTYCHWEGWLARSALSADEKPRARREALEEAARWHIGRAERCQTQRTDKFHRSSAKAIRALIDKPEGGVE